MQDFIEENGFPFLDTERFKMSYTRKTYRNPLFVPKPKVNKPEDEASFLDDDEKGLLASLRREREACALSSEDVLDLITEWKTLARKHGISGTPRRLGSLS